PTTGCPDGPFEPNDTVPSATVAGSLPAIFEGVLCPGDISSTLGVVADLFYVTVADGEVLQAMISDGAVDTCTEQTLIVEIFDDTLTTLHAFERSDGLSCPTAVAGWGAGGYYVLVSSLDGTTEALDYTLTLDTTLCTDNDADTWLSAGCGGPDCNDSAPGIGPGALEIAGDGIDQDCDGGDDLVAECVGSPVMSNPVIGDLPCGDTRVAPVWDGWEILVDPLQEVNIIVDNGLGSADLVAHVLDRNGTAHYGYGDGGTALDDDWDCTVDPWTDAFGDGGCPRDCLTTQGTPGSGPLQIWISQKDGPDCVDAAEYSLSIQIEGLSVAPSPIPGANDMILPWPP
ncbi:MAG TPA: hypothetical protein ENK18_19915, partial [Deltaproteobacteria bacterium]|nr:hypothetical protein [Deltaproteobacteria bacterium]